MSTGRRVAQIAAALLLLFFADAGVSSGQERPSIGIISPVPNGVVTAPDVTVEVEVTDFILVPPTGSGDRPGQGHTLYFLDFEPVFVPGQSAIPTDPNVIYAATDQTSHTFEAVGPGPHYVVVLLVLDNHVPVFPPTIDKVSFTILAPAETPHPQPTPAVTETGSAPSGQKGVPTPTPSTGVLPAQVPALGAAPQQPRYEDDRVWLLAGIAVGILPVAGVCAVFLRRIRSRR